MNPWSFLCPTMTKKNRYLVEKLRDQNLDRDHRLTPNREIVELSENSSPHQTCPPDRPSLTSSKPSAKTSTQPSPAPKRSKAKPKAKPSSSPASQKVRPPRPSPPRSPSLIRVDPAGLGKCITKTQLTSCQEWGPFAKVILQVSRRSLPQRGRCQVCWERYAR